MKYDLEIEIGAPVERVYHLVCNWHSVPLLRRLAGVKSYTPLGGSVREEYYRLEVSDLPLLTSYCYGKRLSKPPTTVVNMFLYRFFKSRRLDDSDRIDTFIEERWEDFFYQTVRLQPLPSSRTRLYYLDSTGLESRSKRSSFSAYFDKVRELSESELVPTGVDVVAEPADDEVFPEDDDLAGDEGAYETEETFTYDIYDDYNPWQVLGLSPGASQDEVKKAYRRLAREHHPDRKGHGTSYGHNQFVEITAAYHAILRDIS